MKTLYQYLTNKIHIILPGCTVLFFIYVRFFNARPPRLLYIELSYTLFFVTTLCLGFACIRIYFIMTRNNYIHKKPTEPHSQEILQILKRICLNCLQRFNNLWSKLYIEVLDKWPQIHMAILSLVRVLYQAKTRVYIGFILLLDVFPRVIVVFCFLIDIFWFRELHYFYKSLMLLVLPLVLNLTLKIFAQFYETNHINLENAIIFKQPGNDKKQFNVLMGVTFEYAPEYIPPKFIKNVNEFMYEHYIPIITIVDMLNDIVNIKKYLKLPLIDLLIANLYVIGWVSILLLGVHFF